MVKERGYRRHRFVRRYTPTDIELLAGVDEAHETLSGPATQKILYREFHNYGDERYQRLSAVSVPHIYNLRKSRVYRDRRIGGGPTRKAGLGTCGSTQCIRETWTAPRGCTPSTQWMR